VVGVIFGTLGLSCLPFNFGSFVTYGWPVEGSKSGTIDLWCFGSTFLGLGLSLLLLLSSLGCYHFQWWGRYGMLLWAFVSLGYGIVGVYFWGRFLLPGLRSQLVAMRGPDEISGLIAWIMGSGFSIFVLMTLLPSSSRRVFVDDPTHV
jgi:hypothetical protein